MTAGVLPPQALAVLVEAGMTGAQCQEESSSGNQETGPNPGAALTFCVALGQLDSLSGPQFSQL